MQIFHVSSARTSSLSGIVTRQDSEARSKVRSVHLTSRSTPVRPLKQGIINLHDKRPARSTLLVKAQLRQDRAASWFARNVPWFTWGSAGSLVSTNLNFACVVIVATYKLKVRNAKEQALEQVAQREQLQRPQQQISSVSPHVTQRRRFPKADPVLEQWSDMPRPPTSPSGPIAEHQANWPHSARPMYTYGAC